MSKELLRTFDGSLEGAAALDPEREDGINWHEVQQSITDLEIHVQSSRQALELFNNHAMRLEESLLKLTEGDPIRDNIFTEWEKMKSVVESMRTDLEDTESIIQALMLIPLTQETMHLPPERLQ